MKKRILIVSEFYYPNESGSERSARAFAEELYSMGFDVRVLTSCYHRDLKSFESLNGVKVIRALPKYSGYRILAHLQRLLSAGIIIRHAKNCDWVEGHLYNSLIIPMVITKFILSSRIGVVFTYSDIEHFKSANKVDYLCFKYTSKYFDIILLKGQSETVFNNHFNSSHVVQMNNICGKFNEILIEDKIENRRYDVGFLGKLTDSKNPLFVVELAKRFPNYTFAICGHGELLPQIAYMSKQLSNLHLIPKEESIVFLVECKTMLFPYRTEPAFAQSIMEALLSECLVICSYSMAMEKITEGEECIFLVRYLSLDIWADKVEYTLDNYSQYRGVARAGKSLIVNNHSPSNYCLKWNKNVWNISND